MFLENASRKGWIEVICGSMFSGKTEELIRRLKRARYANQKVEIFKPRIDVRYSEEEVVSHDANAIRSTPVDSPRNILLMTSEVDVVGIDEAQFFDDSIVEVCRELADSGVRVIVAGLDMDYTGKPFGPMPALMAKRTPTKPSADTASKSWYATRKRNKRNGLARGTGHLPAYTKKSTPRATNAPPKDISNVA